MNPGYAEAHASLGNILNDAGKHHKATDSLRRAIHLRPDYAEAYCSLGDAYTETGQLDEAIESYRSALRIEPAFAEAHCNLGNIFCDQGRYEAAATSYEQALQLKPDFAAVHNNLSQIKTYRDGDPQIEEVRRQLARTDIDDESRMHLDFAQGKIFDDFGQVDRAFECLQEGNRLKKEALGYEISHDRKRFGQIKSLFADCGVSGDSGFSPDDRFNKHPIFIVGMPRSGTTLVEQILASHSEVFGAGELPHLHRLLNPLLDGDNTRGDCTPGFDEWLNLKDAYMDKLGQLSCSEPYVTDKMPGNFKWLGFLLTTMPHAKIIHLQRDPVATCWSVFRHHFGGGGNGYSYDLEDVAEYYKLYLDLMAHWRQTFPGRIYDLNYESLTELQDREIAGMLEYCGLEWEDRCLDFHKNRRSVRTASGGQVRQAMYKGSSDAWRKYEAHLGPLLESLGH
jgi:cytochrome c-type biogenesis protein CcmH/NrfG